jgi:hypothetical protein
MAEKCMAEPPMPNKLEFDTPQGREGGVGSKISVE